MDPEVAIDHDPEIVKEIEGTGDRGARDHHPDTETEVETGNANGIGKGIMLIATGRPEIGKDPGVAAGIGNLVEVEVAVVEAEAETIEIEVMKKSMFIHFLILILSCCFFSHFI